MNIFVASLHVLPSGEEEEARLPSKVPNGPHLRLPVRHHRHRRQPADHDEHVRVLHHHGGCQHEKCAGSAHQRCLTAPTVLTFVALDPSRARAACRDPRHLWVHSGRQ